MRYHLSYAVTILAILMVSQAAIAGAVTPKLLVVPAPLAPYADAILQGLARSEPLLRPGQSPHDFALAPSQARALAEADIILLPDLSMNPVLARLIARQKHLRVIELSKLEGASPLPYAPENPFLSAHQLHAEDKNEENHHHAHENEDASLDPHLWLDPERMAAMALPLARAIAETAPEAKPLLENNARALARHLRSEVMPALRSLLDKPRRTQNAVGRTEIPFITYHAAYQYFLARFQIDNPGELTRRPEEMMGAKRITKLLDSANDVQIRCVIGEAPSPLMQRIAKITQARVVLLNPEQLVGPTETDALDWMQNDYDRLLYQITKDFAACL